MACEILFTLLFRHLFFFLFSSCVLNFNIHMLLSLLLRMSVVAALLTTKILNILNYKFTLNNVFS